MPELPEAGLPEEAGAFGGGLAGALAGLGMIVAGGVVIGALSELSLPQPARTTASAAALATAAMRCKRREIICIPLSVAANCETARKPPSEPVLVR